MNDKLQPILVIVATVGMIIFNYFAATGFAGGVATNVPSDKYPTHITPSGYAFAIWSLIYLGCLAFSIYQALPSQLERFRPLRRIYIVSCVANCAWLYFWSQEMIVVCFGVILVLLGTLAIINTKLQKTETYNEFWLVKFPFGIYFGWVTAASLVNFAVLLVYLKVDLGSSATVVGPVLILFAAALAVLLVAAESGPLCNG